MFRPKGRSVGKGATANVSVMCRRKGSKDDLYAVKEFRDRNSEETEEEHVRKIKSEYTLAHSVNHPNIVRTFSLCIDKHRRYNQIMEYCPIELYNLGEQGLFKAFYTYEARLCFFKQILRAVDYLHEHGIAHRDVKLENILMDSNGHLKLTDFGVSEVFCGDHPGARASRGRCGQNMGETRLCPPGICGSLPYISPEVMERKVRYDPTKLDSWSCGVLWLTMSCSGNLWTRPSEDSGYYGIFIKGWNEWMAKHPATVPNDDIGYPDCGRYMSQIGPSMMKKVVLKLLHPNPDLRISVYEALQHTAIRNAQCCCAESHEPASSIDASQGEVDATPKLYKHDHLPRSLKKSKSFRHPTP